MSLAAASPTLFFDRDDLLGLVQDFSQAMRLDPQLAGVVHPIVGNQWEALERGVSDLIMARLSGEMVPHLSPDHLNRTLTLLSRDDCHRLHATFLQAVFAHFPLLDAANFAGVADEVLAWILPLLEPTDRGQQQRRLILGLRDWRGICF